MRLGALPLSGLVAPGRVVVLVGAAASGKTTVRAELVTVGLDAERVVSLDDLRAAARRADLDAGRDPRALQRYSFTAVREALRRQQELLADGRGYVTDATNLRRRERVAHVRAAAAAGLPSVALLTPLLPVEVLEARNTLRPADRRVPDDVLARHVHRRGLLGAELLLGEGFAAVHEM